jgi:hypothetical protein
MAPVLTANVLTVTFVYCFAKIHKKELKGEEEGHLTYLWLNVLVFLFMLYGLYARGLLTSSAIGSSFPVKRTRSSTTESKAGEIISPHAVYPQANLVER